MGTRNEDAQSRSRKTSENYDYLILSQHISTNEASTAEPSALRVCDCELMVRTGIRSLARRGKLRQFFFKMFFGRGRGREKKPSVYDDMYKTKILQCLFVALTFGNCCLPELCFSKFESCASQWQALRSQDRSTPHPVQTPRSIERLHADIPLHNHCCDVVTLLMTPGYPRLPQPSEILGESFSCQLHPYSFVAFHWAREQRFLLDFVFLLAHTYATHTHIITIFCNEFIYVTYMHFYV